MTRPLDWFDCAAAQQRVKIAERALLGPEPMKAIGAFWGYDQMVVCVGDASHAEREASRLHRNMLWPQECPFGNYKMFDEPVRSVASRLPIWC